MARLKDILQEKQKSDEEKEFTGTSVVNYIVKPSIKKHKILANTLLLDVNVKLEVSKLREKILNDVEKEIRKKYKNISPAGINIFIKNI